MSKENIEKPEGVKYEPQAGTGRRFLAGVLAGGLLGGLVVGSISLYSYATGGLGWRSHSYHRHGGDDPVAARERIEFATDWVLSRINASEDQRQQVKSIVQNAINDLSQVKEQHQQNRQALLDALRQPTVNRAALGEIRQSELQVAETASNRLVDAIADVAEVLSPEQRAKLIELVSRFHR
jgi:periplasmic protein CpxP/Spy